YREITMKDILDVLKSTAYTSTGIIFLIGSAAIFIWYINYENIPNQLMSVLGFAAENPILLLLIINIILLLAGTFIDTISAVTIFTPLLDRKSTRLNSSHVSISYAVFCLKKKKNRHISFLNL